MILRRRLMSVIFACGILAAAGATLLANPKPAAAQCTTCDCINEYHGNVGSSCTTRDIIHQEAEATIAFINEEFTDWETFLRDVFWQKFILPGMMYMTEQMTTVAMHQMLTLGEFMDAQQQIQTQRLFAQLTLQAHQTYHPDMTMCVFGTNVRSLAATERNAEFTTYILGQRSMDRQLANMKSAGARGQYMDQNARVAQFYTFYCDPNEDADNYRGDVAAPLCRSECAQPGNGKYCGYANHDIDYPRMVAERQTLDINFAIQGNDATPDENDTFAIANNLYASNTMFRLPPVVINSPYNQDEILDMRSVVAKRSVAENSFNTIIGLKTQSTGDDTAAGGPGGPGGGQPANPHNDGEETGKYMKIIMKQLGLTDDNEITELIGDRPSYDAQMNILTKRIYQQPDFFVDLVDRPINTERKKVAMQAIGLMQNFDLWQSHLRTEAMLSVLLEMEIMKSQEEVQNRINKMKPGGRTNTGW